MKHKRLRFHNMKQIGYFVIVLELTKYKTLEIVFAKKEKASIRLSFTHRPNCESHKGFSIVINLLFFEFQFDFYDVRHVEDYDKS